MKYILFQKDSLLFSTQKQTQQFSFEDFLEKNPKKDAAYKLETYRKQLPLILEKFLDQGEFQPNDSITLLFDHPWLQVYFLTMPWITKRKLEKIIPFEIQKKMWLENNFLKQDFLLLPDKKKKIKRVIVYGVEKQLLSILAALFVKKKLNLQGVESYAHWLERSIYKEIVQGKKQIARFILSFSNNYATGFLYDELGLKASYNLPIEKKQVSKSFWQSFALLLKRIDLTQNQKIDIFYQKNNQYILLDLNQPPVFPLDHFISYRSLEIQNENVQSQKQQLKIYKRQFHWNLNQWQANKNFFKELFYQGVFLTKNIKIFQALPRVRKFLLIAGVVVFTGALSALEYQESIKEKNELLRKYHSYLEGYLLQRDLEQELVEQKLLEQTREWKKLQVTQKKYLKKDYKVSKFLLQVNKLSKNVEEMQITELELSLPKFRLYIKGDGETLSKSKELFRKNFKLLGDKKLGSDVLFLNLEEK
jgi:hypothetical protein